MRLKFMLGSILVFLVFVSSADAQPQEEHQTEYPSECLADWDPFCPSRPAGSGYAYSVGCYDCVYIPEGPEGQPAHYHCSNSGGTGDPSRCTNYYWGCEMDGVCKLA